MDNIPWLIASYLVIGVFAIAISELLLALAK
jgi:hypothetical protein